MGYPVEKIDKETQLFVYIGPDAIEEERDVLFNRHFKEADVNKTLMPLNIREDDFGFFIHNFKNSKIKAAIIAPAYQELLHSLLEEMSEEAKFAGMIDTLGIENERYVADVVLGRATAALLQERCAPEEKTIAIVGATPAAKTILTHLLAHSPRKITLYDEVVERTLPIMQHVGDAAVLDIEAIHDKQIASIEADILIDTLCRYDLHFAHTPECIVTVPEHCTRYAQIDTTLFTYDDIFAKIAQLKTKEWIEDVRI